MDVCVCKGLGTGEGKEAKVRWRGGKGRSC